MALVQNCDLIFPVTGIISNPPLVKENKLKPLLTYNVSV